MVCGRRLTWSPQIAGGTVRCDCGANVPAPDSLDGQAVGHDAQAVEDDVKVDVRSDRNAAEPSSEPGAPGAPVAPQDNASTTARLRSSLDHLRPQQPTYAFDARDVPISKVPQGMRYLPLALWLLITSLMIDGIGGGVVQASGFEDVALYVAIVTVGLAMSAFVLAYFATRHALAQMWMMMAAAGYAVSVLAVMTDDTTMRLMLSLSRTVGFLLFFIGLPAAVSDLEDRRIVAAAKRLLWTVLAMVAALVISVAVAVNMLFNWPPRDAAAVVILIGGLVILGTFIAVLIQMIMLSSMISAAVERLPRGDH